MSLADTARINEEKNQGAYLRDSSSTSLEMLLARSKNLMDQEGGARND